MGRLPETLDWLNRAFEIAERVGYRNRLWLKVLHEPDLEPLWQGFGASATGSFLDAPDQVIGFGS
jgi:hypothetical protein